MIRSMYHPVIEARDLFSDGRIQGVAV